METKNRKAYNLSLSIYSHVRHHDYKSARYLLLELIELINEFVKEEELEAASTVKDSK